MNINKIFENCKARISTNLTEIRQNRDFSKLTPENAEALT